MTSGAQDRPGSPEQREPNGRDCPEGLADYIDENREDLEALADKEYPISDKLQALIDRRDRGDI
jgi:hypothetical protein